MTDHIALADLQTSVSIAKVALDLAEANLKAKMHGAQQHWIDALTDRGNAHLDYLMLCRQLERLEGQIRADQVARDASELP